MGNTEHHSPFPIPYSPLLLIPPYPGQHVVRPLPRDRFVQARRVHGLFGRRVRNPPNVLRQRRRRPWLDRCRVASATPLGPRLESLRIQRDPLLKSDLRETCTPTLIRNARRGEIRRRIAVGAAPLQNRRADTRVVEAFR